MTRAQRADALLRLAAAVHDLGSAAIVLAAGLWATSFALYSMTFWKILLTPSAPRLSVPP